MYNQMLTSKKGGELISFKVNGEEKIHQGEQCMDENGKIYWKRHSPVLFPIVGKLKKNQTLIGGRTYELRFFPETTKYFLFFLRNISFLCFKE